MTSNRRAILDSPSPAEVSVYDLNSISLFHRIGFDLQAGMLRESAGYSHVPDLFLGLG